MKLRAQSASTAAPLRRAAPYVIGQGHSDARASCAPVELPAETGFRAKPASRRRAERRSFIWEVMVRRMEAKSNTDHSVDLAAGEPASGTVWNWTITLDDLVDLLDRQLVVEVPEGRTVPLLTANRSESFLSAGSLCSSL